MFSPHNELKKERIHRVAFHTRTISGVFTKGTPFPIRREALEIFLLRKSLIKNFAKDTPPSILAKIAEGGVPLVNTPDDCFHL